MGDLNEVIITGTIQEISHKTYNDKSFIELIIASNSGYEGKAIDIPCNIWGKAVERFSSHEGDVVAVKGQVNSRKNKDFLNATIGVYSVIELNGEGLEL